MSPGPLASFMAAVVSAPGDRVAGFLPNVSEAVVAVLAGVSLGALCNKDCGQALCRPPGTQKSFS